MTNRTAAVRYARALFDVNLESGDLRKAESDLDLFARLVEEHEGLRRVLFAAAVLIAIFPGGLGAVNSALIAFNHLLIELSFYTALAFCLNTEAVAGRYLRAKTWIDRGAAAVLGALGLRILLSR